jgi:O-acetyl-ADP-ribose deacetylase (regulator of RNase III)
LNPVLIDKGLAPRGSAALTPSGALAATGIKYVIHAASGAMSQGGVNETPTLEGVKLSIINAIRIATAEKIKRIAIPLIGGGIFLDTLGVSKEQLAYTIIDTARTQKSPVEIIFVAYSDDETAVMNNAYARAENPDKFALKIWNYLRQLFAGTTDFFNRSQVSQGSITDFNAHGAEAIVNAANMELMFGGGLSGIIGKATQDREHIDETGALLIKSFYGSQGKK